MDYAFFNPDGSVTAGPIDGQEWAGINEGSAFWPLVEEWVAAGNVISLSVAPPIDLSAYAAQKRWEREVGGIEFAGLTVATDDRSKIMISGARIKADKDPAFVTSWKGPDGQFLTLDAETIISVSDAVLDHVNDCFALEASVLSQIAAGEIDDISGVDAAFNA